MYKVILYLLVGGLCMSVIVCVRVCSIVCACLRFCYMLLDLVTSSGQQGSVAKNPTQDWKGQQQSMDM